MKNLGEYSVGPSEKTYLRMKSSKLGIGGAVENGLVVGITYIVI